MTTFSSRLLILSACLFVGVQANGASTKWHLKEWITSSHSIYRGTALSNEAFEKAPNGDIHTVTGVSVSEIFKGTVVDTIQVENSGGQLNGRGEDYCGNLRFETGNEYLIFIRCQPDGTLCCNHYISSSDPTYTASLQALRHQETGSETPTQPSTILSSTPQISEFVTQNVLNGATGYTSRFLHGDRSEPIAYFVDMDSLPTGITTNQALAAISNAFAAWSEETLLTFRFAGIESFGKAARYVTTHENQICIQLHDNYNYIADSSFLGRGGRFYRYDDTNWPDGGLGGKIGINEFDESTFGYVVLEHGKTALSNPITLEEVLCHEIGHVLSLAHSSDDESESDATLSEAMMFYLAHEDGRGASLASWDSDSIQPIYPADNTPPYGYDRIIRAIFSPPPQASVGSGVNQTEMEFYDRQGGAAPVLISATANNGTFSLVGSNTVFYTPLGWFGPDDTPETGEGSFYDLRTIRISDGVNLSPPILIRVVQLLSDDNQDQLPNSWAFKYGVSGGASSDHDGDGATNLEEWFLDTDPTDALSNFSIDISSVGISWNSRANDLYQILSTTNLEEGFSHDGNPIRASSTNETLLMEFEDHKFYRVQRLP